MKTILDMIFESVANSSDGKFEFGFKTGYATNDSLSEYISLNDLESHSAVKNDHVILHHDSYDFDVKVIQDENGANNLFFHKLIASIINNNK